MHIHVVVVSLRNHFHMQKTKIQKKAGCNILLISDHGGGQYFYIMHMFTNIFKCHFYITTEIPESVDSTTNKSNVTAIDLPTSVASIGEALEAPTCIYTTVYGCTTIIAIAFVLV